MAKPHSSVNQPSAAPNVKTVSPEEFTKLHKEASEKTAKLMEKARAAIILDFPFFASMMLKRPMVETLSVPTLAVTDAGKIYFNPFFVAGLNVQNVIWAICHEVMHYASGHGLRRGNRDHMKWNWAGDAWINSVLEECRIGKRIDGTVFVPGSHLSTVEEIYANIPPEDECKPNGQTKDQTDGPGPHSFSDDPMGNDIGHKDEEGDGGGQSRDVSPEEAEAQRKLDVAEAGQVAKMRGKMPGVLSEFVSATVDSKVPWHSILERFMTERVQQDYSWQRPNRRYLPDHYLPSIDGVGSMGTVVCQVDISGSVSAKEIEYYNGHMKRIVEQCRPNKVHVIYTDTRVQKHEIFDRPEDLEIRFYSGGGTDMTAGVAYVEEQGIEPAVMVTLTDGYTPWCDSEPDFPTVWCISSKETSPIGENVHFSLND